MSPLGRTSAPSDPKCPAQVQWGWQAAPQRATSLDAYGVGEPGTLDCK